MGLRILLEHPRLLAVDKPPGLVVVPARREDPADSLWRRLEEARGERLWVVHRLDRDTSGVVVLARDAEAHRSLSMDFEQRRVEKRYVALTRGLPPAPEGAIEIALHTARRGKMRPAHPGEQGALASLTGYRVHRSWSRPALNVALLDLEPKTGRAHQIRVHLRAIGAPLLVDPLYGRSRAVTMADLGLSGSETLCDRLTLHAAALVVCDPDGGTPIALSAPLPPDLEAIVAALDSAQ